MYARYMLVAFVTNGLAAFGLRVLAGAGVGDKYFLPYLCLWYLGGCLMAVYPFLRTGTWPNRQELLLSAAMAACSVCGQVGMLLALSGNLPGFVVFPVATGGGLLLVLAVGILFFHERLSTPGYVGIGLGMAALILLALP